MLGFYGITKRMCPRTEEKIRINKLSIKKENNERNDDIREDEMIEKSRDERI